VPEDSRDKAYWRKRARKAEKSLRTANRLFLVLAACFYAWLFRDELISLLGKLPPVGADA